VIVKSQSQFAGFLLLSPAPLGDLTKHLASRVPRLGAAPTGASEPLDDAGFIGPEYVVHPEDFKTKYFDIL
jgi:hypothetical protein